MDNLVFLSLKSSNHIVNGPFHSPLNRHLYRIHWSYFTLCIISDILSIIKDTRLRQIPWESSRRYQVFSNDLDMRLLVGEMNGSSLYGYY